jgi:hypothetical protein
LPGIALTDQQRERQIMGMPAFKWPLDLASIVTAFEHRSADRGESGALIMTAAWTTQELHYLDDLDQPAQRKSAPATKNSELVVGMAHVRWATATAITALDLCAVVLGKVCCGEAGELDLRHLDPSSSRSRVPERRAKLPVEALAWVDAVVADPRYADVHAARNPLVHSRLIRHFFMEGADHTHVALPPTGKLVRLRELVESARDLATVRVGEFLAVVEKL